MADEDAGARIKTNPYSEANEEDLQALEENPAKFLDYIAELRKKDEERKAQGLRPVMTGYQQQLADLAVGRNVSTCFQCAMPVPWFCTYCVNCGLICVQFHNFENTDAGILWVQEFSKT